MLLTNAHGDDGIFYGGQEYTVPKAVAERLLEDPRVAVPVRSSGKTEHAVVDDEG